jgi:hypothetical protein
MIVTPILESLKKIINNNIIESINNNTHNLDNLKLLTETVTNINNGILSKQIIKYIAPYFNLERSDEIVDTKKLKIK